MLPPPLPKQQNERRILTLDLDEKPGAPHNRHFVSLKTYRPEEGLTAVPSFLKNDVLRAHAVQLLVHKFYRQT